MPASPTQSDLAGLLPSKPIADKKPVPADPSGALGGLRLALAGVVVPHIVLPLLSDSVREFLTLGLPGLMLLLVTLFIFNYGLWLRRGGFETAARSDAPSAFSQSKFATPHLKGYVSTLRLWHSPLLVVAETDTYLFPTLQERRACV
jgi:hypothetical protein